MDATIISRFTSAIIDKITELIGIHDTSGTAHSNIRNSIPEANTLASNIQMDGTASAGTGTDYARANHVHPKSSIYAEASHTHSEYVNSTIVDNLNSTSSTSVLSARQGKVLKDLIGDAIDYINQ